MFRRILRMPFQLISSLMQQATAHGSKSTVMRPLGWLVAICGSLLLGAIELKAPQPVMWCLMAFLGLSILLYLLSFGYCLVNDRDALRTEKYSIQKLAIEKGHYGDSITGMSQVDQRVLLGTPASKEEQR